MKIKCLTEREAEGLDGARDWEGHVEVKEL
jgi:hypothetical protein